jgi:deazaflavin-dependent oxidoreductase (nitroreductase family)
LSHDRGTLAAISLASMAKTGSPPRWLKAVNKVIVAMNRRGWVVEHGAVLTVAGRRSGVARHTPVSVLDQGGLRYLLAGYPTAEWPRNVRAAGGRATVAVGKRTEAVRLVELDEDAAREILRAWPERIPQGAKVMRGAGVVPDLTPESFARLAGRCPVFRIEAAGPARA